MLELDFRAALSDTSDDEKLIDSFWTEINKSYSAKSRHYHNILHIDNLHRELLAVKHHVIDWRRLVFSIAYHDIVYHTLRQDNEEKSAALAVKRLREAGLTEENCDMVKQQILATKGHTVSPDQDTNLFTDADLSVLGAEPSAYREYAKQIRKEYRLYPDLVYKPGRTKVLRHFLDMRRIFKTEYFFNKYEAAARKNLAAELTELG